MAEDKVVLGVIGGSGLYHLDNLTLVKEVDVQTPWGSPSSPITISSLPSGDKIAFIARHGKNHTINPSSVPSRANIAALKSLGVHTIIAFSAVGSLREEIKPGDFVVPDQIIDRTKGVRPSSFFTDMKTVVAHTSFGEPFSKKLSDWLVDQVKAALKDAKSDVDVHSKKVVVCMEGPQFSTRAESLMYRAWGGDIINMSVIPEAKLAREAELSYALIATSTDYDSWRPHEASVTAHEVIKILHQNASTSRHVAAFVLARLFEALADPKTGIENEEKGGMAFSIMRKPTDPEDIAKMKYFLPEYVDN